MLLDDAAVYSKLAAKKTAGLLGDDLAVNAEKATGFNASRELPVIWAITKGSVVNTDGATADASGGINSYNTTRGGDGRFILGSNTAGADGIAVSGATTSVFDGTRAINPFIVGGAMATPYIPDLVGGAEVYGLLDGIDATDAVFNSLHADASAGALAALWRLDTGPGIWGDDFIGFDILLMVNLTDQALGNPMLGYDPLGLDSGFMSDLLLGGYQNDALFGGSGPGLLGSLNAFSVYATLVPDSGSLFNASVLGAEALSTGLGTGDYAYLYATIPSNVSEPGVLALLLIGLVGIGVKNWEKLEKLGTDHD